MEMNLRRTLSANAWRARSVSLMLVGSLAAAAPSGASNGTSRAAGQRLIPPPAQSQVQAHRRPRVRPDTCSGAGQYSFIGGRGPESHPNVAAGYASGVLSGYGNYACGDDSGVAVGLANETDGQAAFIGGGYGNVAATPNSGVLAGVLNVASGLGDNGIVAGLSNNNQGALSLIGAGELNALTGSEAAIIAGRSNAENADYGAVVAGYKNTVTGTYAFIGAGSTNTASGENAVVPGGFDNVARGIGSFAAGRGARALHNGAFVWSDRAERPLVKSTDANQFIARASGGVTFYSSANLSTGVTLAPGSGSWSSVSDRAVKTGIVPVDAAVVLAKVASLPVSEWSYAAQGTGVRHVGPMAQDFRAAFGVGEDDRHIATVDEGGVALAAIKGLAVRTARDNARLRAQLARDGAEISSLHSQVAQIASLRSVVTRLASEVAAARRTR